jgi:hypothetical protein
LDAAYDALRSGHVNSKLKAVATNVVGRRIGRLADTQRDVIRTLNLVRKGLVAAGRAPRPQRHITLDMTPSGAMGTPIIRDRPPPPAYAPPVGAAAGETDKLTGAMAEVWELQRHVLARTRTLADLERRESPRYMDLKKRILDGYRRRTLDALGRAADEVKEMGDEPIRDLMRQVGPEFERSLQLVADGHFGEDVQQLQVDCMDALNDAMRFALVNRAVSRAADEARQARNEGAQDLPEAIPAKDLDGVADVLRDLNHAALLQRCVLRREERLQGRPATNASIRALWEAGRARAASDNAKAIAIMTGLAAREAALSDAVATRLIRCGVGPVSEAEPVPFVGSGKSPPAITAALKDRIDLLDRTLRRIAREILGLDIPGALGVRPLP